MKSIVLTGMALALVLALPGAAGADTGYKLLKTIALPGEKGGHGDWVTWDAQTGTVWLSQSPDHQVVVIEGKAMTVKGTVPGIEDPNGIALSPQYAFIADAKGNAVLVVEKTTLKKVGTLDPGKGPDSVNYLPKENEVFVSGEADDGVIFSAAPPFAEKGHFKLSPNPAKDGPDVALGVAELGRLYQPVDNVIDVIDPAKMAVETVWKPQIEGSAKPLVYDPKTRHLIAGTSDKRMLVLDPSSGKELARIPVRGAVDETAIDEKMRRAFVGDKAGLVEVIDLDTDKVIGSLPAEKNVHTLAVDPQSHRVFVYLNESNKLSIFAPENVAAQ